MPMREDVVSLMRLGSECNRDTSSVTSCRLHHSFPDAITSKAKRTRASWIKVPASIGKSTENEQNHTIYLVSSTASSDKRSCKIFENGGGKETLLGRMPRPYKSVCDCCCLPHPAIINLPGFSCLYSSRPTIGGALLEPRLRV